VPGEPAATAVTATHALPQGDAGVALEPATEPVHCKALGKNGFVTIGSQRETLEDFVARYASVYVFSFYPELARSTLLRIPRDGTAVQVIGRYTGLGEPKGFVLTSDAGYFTLKRNVIRMELQGGEPRIVAKEFSTKIAAFGEFIYGVRCAKKGHTDHLVRVSNRGGEPEELAAIERVPPRSAGGRADCDYDYLAVDSSSVFISDWGGQRLLVISQRDMSVRELVTRKAWPMKIVLEPEHVVYQATGGLFRVARAGGDPVKLTEAGGSPFPRFDVDANDFWVDHVTPYTWHEAIYRVPRNGGEAKRVELFPVSDGPDNRDDTVDGIAVDDECLYLARHQKGIGSIQAKTKHR
jgi:hypothetical protein